MSRNPFNPIKSARGFSKDRPNTYMLKNNDSCIIQENTKKSTRNTQMNRTLKDMKNEVNRNKKSMANTSFNNSTIDDHKPPRSSSQNANHSPNILSCYIA